MLLNDYIGNNMPSCCISKLQMISLRLAVFDNIFYKILYAQSSHLLKNQFNFRWKVRLDRSYTQQKQTNTSLLIFRSAQNVRHSDIQHRRRGRSVDRSARAFSGTRSICTVFQNDVIWLYLRRPRATTVAKAMNMYNCGRMCNCNTTAITALAAQMSACR